LLYKPGARADLRALRLGGRRGLLGGAVDVEAPDNRGISSERSLSDERGLPHQQAKQELPGLLGFGVQ
jgi:hypothetical protein